MHIRTVPLPDLTDDERREREAHLHARVRDRAIDAMGRIMVDTYVVDPTPELTHAIYEAARQLAAAAVVASRRRKE